MPNDILQDEKQLKDNLTRIIKSFNETLPNEKGKTRDIAKDFPPTFHKTLYEYATKFEREVGSIGHSDPNVKFLGAMGAMLLSWAIAISRAKEGDGEREFINNEIRARSIDTVYWNSKEYLDLILREAFDIAPRLNEKNSLIKQASEGYHPTVNTKDEHPSS
jgi:hypothetical protein